MPNRREFYRLGSLAVGGLMAAALAVPGVGYVLSPLLRKGPGAGDDAEGEFFPLARLGELEPGVPQARPVIAGREDAWVSYPSEPIGSVWLIRQPEGSAEPVRALSAECPHLGCGVNLAAGGSSFACPCHTSAFTLAGEPTNEIPPRPMDALEVKLSGDDDPVVLVRFRRFRPQSKEKIPLA